MLIDFRSYPMIVVLAVVITSLLLIHRFYPSLLLYETEYDQIDSLRTYTFVLKSDARETARCMRYEAEVVGIGRVLLYLPKDSSSDVAIGDTLMGRTRIRRGGRIGAFDYGLYLRRRGILGTAYLGQVDRLCPCHQPIPPSLQQRLYRRLSDAGLSGDELATTGALTLGYKEDLDPALRQRFQASGAAHVLAVSGLHTGIIYALLLGLLTVGGRFKPGYENRVGRLVLSLLIIALMWGYAWLTGMTPSVVRCVVMVSLVEVGRLLYRSSTPLNTLASSAVLILCVRPLDLWSISFQLSFAATTAIILFAKDMERMFHPLEWRYTWYGNICAWFAGTIIVSIAAQLGTMPISMHTFGQVSNYFLLTNLLVLPLATLLVPCGLACLALGGTLLGQGMGCLTHGLAWLMNNAVGGIEHLPGSSTAVSITTTMMLLLYAALFMGWLSVHPRHPARPQRAMYWLIGVAASLAAFCILYLG